MDSLLYLCNLHADGPATLRRLHAHDVRSAADLARIPTERLAEWLGTSPAAARRFVREATLATGTTRELELEEGSLLERLDDELRRPLPADSIALDALRPTAEEALRPTAPEAPRARERTRLASLPLDEIAPTGPLPSRKIATPSITTAPPWPAKSPAVPNQTAQAARHPGIAHVHPLLTNPRPPTPARTTALPLTPDTLLRPGMVEGLDARMVEKLIAEGFRTAGQLAHLPASRLAPLVGTSSAFLENLCQLAARALATSPERAASPGTPPTATEGGERIYELRPQPRTAPPRPIWTPGPAETLAAAESAPPLRRSVRAPIEDVAGPFAS